MTSTQVGLPEGSLKTNLDGGCEWAGVVAEAMAGKRTAQPSARTIRGRILRIRAAPYSAFCGPDKRFLVKNFIITI